MNNLSKTDKVNAPIIGVLSFLLIFYIGHTVGSVEVQTLIGNMYVILGLLVVFAVGALLSLYMAQLLQKYIKEPTKVTRFALVGVLNTLVDVAAFTFIATYFGAVTAASFIAVKIASFIIANVHSYVWNKLWVFDQSESAKNDTSVKQIGAFFGVSLVGLIVNTAAFTAVSFAIAFFAETSVLTGISAVFLAAIVSMAWNFVGYKLFVFEKK